MSGEPRVGLRERLAKDQAEREKYQAEQVAAIAELNLFFASEQGKKVWKVLSMLSNPMTGEIALTQTGADVNMTFFALGRSSVSKELLMRLDPKVAADLTLEVFNAAV